MRRAMRTTLASLAVSAVLIGGITVAVLYLMSNTRPADPILGPIHDYLEKNSTPENQLVRFSVEARHDGTYSPGIIGRTDSAYLRSGKPYHYAKLHITRRRLNVFTGKRETTTTEDSTYYFIEDGKVVGVETCPSTDNPFED